MGPKVLFELEGGRVLIEGKAVIAKQEIKQIIAVKVGPGKATLGILTDESDDVALYSYVSRDKTITPINF